MAEDQGLTASDFLDRVFDEIRLEARSNPQFASRLVKAMGGNVVFEGDARAEVLSPYVLAANSSKPEFYAAFANMKATEIRKILRDNNLATRIDMARKTPLQLVDMLYERASSKVAERKSSIF